jgi:glutamate 5-kinase
MTTRVVIKIGTNSLVHDDRLAIGVMASLVEACAELQANGHQVIVVSSGAVGVGCQRVGITSRPTNMAARQALAAVGQIRLMRMYDNLFSAAGKTCAQVLLTFENLSCASQHRNAKNTFESLLSMGVIPIVNENDTVATSELKFGDNDRLSAMVAALVGAQCLFLLTDVDGVYTANPKENPDAKRLEQVQDVDKLASMVSTGDDAGSTFSTGGMATKLAAARLASAAGARTVIMSAKRSLDMLKALNGEHVGTTIMPKGQPIKKDRKRWILGLRSEGVVVINEGAARALERKKNLLPSGIVEVRGEFGELSCVSIEVVIAQKTMVVEEVVEEKKEKKKKSNSKKEISGGSGGGSSVVLAMALVNYTSDQLLKIKGCHSDSIAEMLGQDEAQSSEVAHRQNIVLMRDNDGF